MKAEREAVAWVLRAWHAPALPCVVHMTRLAPSNGLDDDNLRGALKGVRDELARWLGVDDRSPLVTWQYDQRRGEYAVEVAVSV